MQNIYEVFANNVIEDKIINLQISKREEIDNKFNDIRELCKENQEKQSKNDLQINVPRLLLKKKTKKANKNMAKNEIYINYINKIDEEESIYK